MEAEPGEICGKARLGAGDAEVSRDSEAEAATDRLPWMAHVVLRMFPYAPVAESLAELGYETSHVEGVFKQRRFVSDEEQALVLDSLADVGVDPTGLESDGWLYARLHISLPTDTKDHEADR